MTMLIFPDDFYKVTLKSKRSRFIVGDKVRIIDRTGLLGFIGEGSIGTITSNDDDVLYFVRFSGDDVEPVGAIPAAGFQDVVQMVEPYQIELITSKERYDDTEVI